MRKLTLLALTLTCHHVFGDINVILDRKQGFVGGNVVQSVKTGVHDFTPNRWSSSDMIYMIEHSPACSENLPPPPTPQSKNEPRPKWILLTSDFRCSVDEMIKNAQKMRYHAIIIYPFQSGDTPSKNGLLNISPSLKFNVDINVYFVTERDGQNLRKFTYPFANEEDSFPVRFGKGPKPPRKEKESKHHYRSGSNWREGGTWKPHPLWERWESLKSNFSQIFVHVVILGAVGITFYQRIKNMKTSTSDSSKGQSTNKGTPSGNENSGKTSGGGGGSGRYTHRPPPSSPPPPRRPPPPPPAERELTIRECLQLLDVNYSSNRQQIERAYRKKALLFHSDKHQNEPEEVVRWNTQQFIMLTKAKDKLISSL